MASDPYALAGDAARALAEATGVERHDALVVLGSGWAGAADALGEVVAEVDVSELPGFLAPVAPGHGARILSTRLGGDIRRDIRPETEPNGASEIAPDGDSEIAPDGDSEIEPSPDDAVLVLVALGRTHLYEGHGAQPVVHTVRTAAAAGCRTAVLTNAGGALRRNWAPGTGVVLRDHLNLADGSPLSGPRFVDLTDAYAPRLRELAHAVDPNLAEGVYALMRGPAFETVAEARMLRMLGADLVGMSTVPEVIAARDLGLAVLALSVVASVEPLEYGAPGVDADEVVRVASAAATRLGPVLATVLLDDAEDHRSLSREAHDGH